MFSCLCCLGNGYVVLEDVWGFVGNGRQEGRLEDREADLFEGRVRLRYKETVKRDNCL